MKKLKIVQIGVCHEHANGKHYAVDELKDIWELVGYVDERAYCADVRYADYSREFENVPRFTEEEVYARNDIDAVLVEVPNDDLVPTALRVMEHNLPMHMDKPAGTDLGLYKKLLDGCGERGLPFQMGYMFRGNPVFMKVQELAKAGAFGDILSIDIDMDHSYGDDRYQTYIGQQKGGLIYNLGCHMIDFVLTMMNDREPDEVKSFLTNTPDQPAGVENNTLCVLTYPHTLIALRSCSRKMSLQGTYERQCRVGGTKGCCSWKPLERFDGIPQTLDIFLKEPCCGIEAGQHTLTFPPMMSYAQRYTRQLTEFASMVRGETKSSYTFGHDFLVHKTTLRAAGII